MKPLKVAVLHIGEDAIGIETAIGFSTLLRNAGHYVVLGIPADSPAEQYCCANIGDWDEIRPYAWLVMTAMEYRQVFDEISEQSTIIRPLDGGLDFRDCDYWIVTGGLPYPALAPLVPYAVYVSDHIALLRKGGVDYAGAILDTLHGAHMLLFPSDLHVDEWRSMALTYETPVLLGKPPIPTKPKKLPAFHLPHGRSFVYFPTANQFTLIPELLRIPIPDKNNFPPTEQIIITPLEGVSERNRGPWPQWQNSLLIDNSLDLVYPIINECEFVLIGPLVDMQDYRLHVAKELGKPVLMLWGKDWRLLPETFIQMQNVRLVTVETLNKFEQKLIQFLKEKYVGFSKNDQQKKTEVKFDQLDPAALTSLMDEGARR